METFTCKEYNYYKRHALFLSDTETKYQYKTEEVKDVINPHDKIFKEILDMKDEAVKFINRNLKLENTKYALKEDEIEKYNRSFITTEFNYMQSDIIYKKRDQNVFFLMEHQSTTDYSMPYRILKYNMEIIESALDIQKLRNKSYKLPIVYTFVIYTGNKKWDANRYIIEKQESLKGVPKEVFGNFRIIDINHYTIEELLENKDLLSDMMLLEKATGIEELEEYLGEIIRGDVNQKQKIFIQRLVKYILKNKIPKETYNQFTRMLEKKKGEEFMFVKILSDWVEEKFGALEEKEQSVAQKEQSVAQKAKDVEKREKNVEKQKKEIAKREKELSGKRKEIINQAKYNIIIGMIKNNIEDKTIMQITKISSNELTKIKKENEPMLANS